jgi:hypothetical protein
VLIEVVLGTIQGYNTHRRCSMIIVDKETTVVETKPFYKSLSFAGILTVSVPLIARILEAFGVPVPEPLLNEVVTSIIQAAGAITGLIGVLRRKDIRLL